MQDTDIHDAKEIKYNSILVGIKKYEKNVYEKKEKHTLWSLGAMD